MNKHILSIVLTAIVSGGVGYYFGRYFRHEEIEKEIADGLVDLKNHYKKRLREMEEKYRNSAKEMGIVITEEPHPLAENPRVEKSENKTDYHRISKREKPSLEEIRKGLVHREYFEESEAETRCREEFHVEEDPGDWPEPYNISEEEYHETYDWYDKKELTYYTLDDVLRDEEEDNWYTDILETVGAETYQMMIEAEIDIVYARDESVSMDYEIQIVRDHCPQNEEVMK